MAMVADEIKGSERSEPNHAETNALLVEECGLSLETIEQRRHERFPFHHPVQVAWLHRGRPTAAVAAIAHDISQGGISFLSRSMVHGRTHGVLLVVRRAAEPILRGIEVMHCQYLGDCEHLVGAKWIPLPTGLRASVRSDHLGTHLIIQPV